MIAWIVYLTVALILFFIIYIAFLGITRGVEAKNKNKRNISKNKENIGKFKKRIK